MVEINNILVEKYENEFTLEFTSGKYKEYGAVSSDTLPNTLRHLANHIEYIEKQ